MKPSLFILLFLFIAGCSAGSGPESGKVSENSPETASEPLPVRFYEETPDHILEVENLTIYPANPEPRYSIDLVPVQTIGNTGDPYLTNIRGCVVDDNGRVIIQENLFPNDKLHVFNPDGTYLTQIGRTGNGPGEYGFVLNFQVKAGKVFVQDRSNRRINVYDANDYSFERTVLEQDWSVMNHEEVRNMNFLTFWTRNDGNHLAYFNRDTDVSGRMANTKYFLVNTDGDILNPEPLVVPSSYVITGGNQRRLTIALPFLGSTQLAISGDNSIYTAWTEDFLIKKYDANGKYQSAFYYPAMGPVFDMDSFTGWFGYTQRDIRNALEASDVDIPETYPVVDGLRVDDENRIWVAVSVKFLETYEWWVLEESGELLARFMWPRDLRIHDIKDGHLYVRDIDINDLRNDEDKIVKYRIDLTER